jgi:hypothetical protein
MLEPRLRDALIDLAQRFAAADVDYYLGGSLMLYLSGYDVSVGDIDAVVAAGSRPQVVDALAGHEIGTPPSREPWRTGWLLQTTMETASGSVGLDVMGDLGLVIEGTLVRFPVAPERHVDIGGNLVPLGNVADWYHLYRVHNPPRAAVVAGGLSDDQIMEAARRLSIDHLFSPTLIVRITTSSEPRNDYG